MAHDDHHHHHHHHHPQSRNGVLAEAPYNYLPETDSSTYLDAQQPFVTWDKTATLPIRYAATGFASEASCPADTLPNLLRQAAASKGDKVCLSVERPCPAAEEHVTEGKWKTWTYAEMYDEVRRAARGMLGLGLRRYDGVSIWGFNSPEWIMGELAAICAGGIAAGVYPTDTADMIAFKAQHSGTSVFLVQSEAKARQVLAVDPSSLPHLRAVVVWSPTEEATAATPCQEVDSRPGVVLCTWQHLVTTAAADLGVDDQALDAVIESLQPGGCCAYIYTSGTTGRPKAVMISHDNIVFETSCALEVLKGAWLDSPREERVVSYLPLSHVAGMMIDIVASIVGAAKTPGWLNVHCARQYDLSKGTLGDRLRAVEPTLFLGVPRVWEKIQEQIQAALKRHPITGVRKRIADFGKAKGLECVPLPLPSRFVPLPSRTPPV